MEEKPNDGVIRFKTRHEFDPLPDARPEDIPTELDKVGNGYLAAIIFVSFTALGCALAALILAIKGIQ